MPKKVLHNQSLLDIAVQENGSVFSAIDWAFKNEIPISDFIEPGTVINEPVTIYKSDLVSAFFKRNNIVVATNYVFQEEDNYEFPQGEFAISF